MVNISQDNLQEILSVVGYPLASLKDLEFGDEKATDQEKLNNIKQLIIWPSLREYFKWFPLLNIVEYMAEDSIILDFPTPETFTVVDARLNTAGFGVKDSVNPFVNNSVYRAVNTTSSYGGGMYGTKYDYDMRISRLYDRMERQSLISTNKAFRLDIDFENRKVVGFSNIMGKLVVSWGCYSEDFNEVPFKRVSEVIKLSQAYLLRYLGNLRGQQISNLPNTFNFSMFLEKADDLEKKVLNKWEKYPKIVVLRE